MNLTLPPTTALVAAWVAVALVMLTLWFMQRKHGDAGIVDVAWSALLGIVAIFLAVTSSGGAQRRILVASLAAIWAFRLAYYLLKDRILANEEDGRYQALRKNWGDRVQHFFFWFFQVQGILVIILAINYLLAMRSPAPLGWLVAAAVIVWIVAVGGESIADRQLARFRAQSNNRGKVCDLGMWKYSRHPNYFFEWIHWWAYVLLAVHASYGWVTIITGPALMLVLILYVTGIPPTEARALQSRGEAYHRYQRTTSAFFPWFRKEDPSS